MLIPLSLIGFLPDAQAQTVTANVTGDPFTIGEGIDDYDEDVLKVSVFERDLLNPVLNNLHALAEIVNVDSVVDPLSERLIIQTNSSTNIVNSLVIDLDTTLGELQQTINQVAIFIVRSTITLLL